MNRVLRVLVIGTLLGTAWLVVVSGTLLLLPSSQVAAQPVPSKPPIQPTIEPTAEPTEEPTAEPSEEPTAEPPEEPTAEPTAEPPEEPTAKPTAKATVAAPQAPPAESKPDPNCQSAIEGYVVNAAGKRTAGAPVKVEGEGWSRGMLTGDDGHYGFAGLCAGTATVSAALPGGQTSATATITLDGQNTSEVDLTVSQGGGSQPASTATVAATATHQAIAAATTPEPSMPSTGFPGWLLVGMALLGTLVLLLAGTCRALVVRARDRS
jgi:hypothetical protein